jgi:hypothetical protein
MQTGDGEGIAKDANARPERQTSRRRGRDLEAETLREATRSPIVKKN